MKVIAFMEFSLPINFFSLILLYVTIFSPSYVRLFIVVYFFFSFWKFIGNSFSLVICFLISASYLILDTKKYLFGLCWKGETVTLLADEKACGIDCMVVIFVQLCWMVYLELSVIALFLYYLLQLSIGECNWCMVL